MLVRLLQWYDSSTTMHVCNDKNQFKTYEDVLDGHEALMRNHNTTKVLGNESVELQETCIN